MWVCCPVFADSQHQNPPHHHAVRASCSAAVKARQQQQALVLHQGQRALVRTATGKRAEYMPSAQLARRMASKWPRPEWHAPWRMYRVVAGHLGCAPAAGAISALLCKTVPVVWCPA